ncbi:L-idonate 5-dehydrogenase [Pectobacterium wasabiae]|uniref:L-idonate 5-dehydrogenase n=1 Tax=Pectobacterium wasabiae TaxID=55208 RepID=A0AAW3EC89_9GAMM|nr:L-idonate 5-dehydrogenase [Pectobacterium wasabiae]AOR63516.1 L-idonate 5-dehydrogenase [Pectobacterium wasabiae CFBP 3304]EJS92819.1 L-idonate 5-dehydrogenase [Pectobacterium wasabiae CFBP 3304]KFX03163.1 L-idonate 5-dehydrogenase [Pectobacterium wasabiae]KGA26851.1 L-idonate 5-dehydrogenase [Pectobacterium wasabiae]
MKKDTLKFEACIVHGKKDVKVEDRELVYTDSDIVVKVECGGICGSDIHYYHEGHAGLSVIKHPMVIGHEFVGKIYKASENSQLKVGQSVAINPSQPCNQCDYCLEGKQNECSTMRFMGSAQFNPHVNGGFAQYVTVSESQCYPYDEKIPSQIMSLAEPTAVVIHAINIAGSLVGKKVLVIGAGPIGALTIASAKASGAVEVVASDISERCRDIALEMGADSAVNPLDEHSIALYCQNKGYFDVVFEASGAPAAIASSVLMTRPNGLIVQIGMGPSPVQYPVAQMLVKELSWKGSFRFINEFATAVKWLEKGIINPQPIISAEYAYQDIEKALITASDKNISSKVLVKF